VSVAHRQTLQKRVPAGAPTGTPLLQ